MENEKYKVVHLIDNTYQVLEFIECVLEEHAWQTAYQGSLSDCEAYIRLKINGYMQ